MIIDTPEKLVDIISTKSQKCSFQLSKSLQNFICQEANFTDEEMLIFQLRCKGWTIVRISMYMQQNPPEDKHVIGYSYSISKVESRIRTIKEKILSLFK